MQEVVVIHFHIEVILHRIDVIMCHVVEHESGVFGGSAIHDRLTRDAGGRRVTTRADRVAFGRQCHQPVSP